MNGTANKPLSDVSQGNDIQFSKELPTNEQHPFAKCKELTPFLVKLCSALGLQREKL